MYCKKCYYCLANLDAAVVCPECVGGFDKGDAGSYQLHEYPDPVYFGVVLKGFSLLAIFSFLFAGKIQAVSFYFDLDWDVFRLFIIGFSSCIGSVLIVLISLATIRIKNRADYVDAETTGWERVEYLLFTTSVVIGLVLLGLYSIDGLNIIYAHPPLLTIFRGIVLYVFAGPVIATFLIYLSECDPNKRTPL